MQAVQRSEFEVDVEDAGDARISVENPKRIREATQWH